MLSLLALLPLLCLAQLLLHGLEAAYEVARPIEARLATRIGGRDRVARLLGEALELIESQRATIERVERERDEARALSAAQNGGNRHASAEWTKTLLKLRETQKERDAILAAGEALSLALSRYGFPMSDEAWRNTGDDAPVNSQACVEARALHQAASAFFLEISGAANVG